MEPSDIRDMEWWLGQTIDMLLGDEDSPSITHRVKENVDGSASVDLQVHIPPGEMAGRLIGRSGTTVNAMRELLGTMYRDAHIHIQIGPRVQTMTAASMGVPFNEDVPAEPEFVR